MSYVKAAYFDLASCNDEFKKGIEYLEQCSINEAIDCFQKACDQGSPSRQLVYKYHSYYGLSLLLSGNDSAIQICRNMFDSSPCDADLALNLVRAEAFQMNRKEAISLLDKALYIHKDHDGLIALKRKMGVRGKKPIPILHRNNPINITLGKWLRKKS